MPSNPVTVWKNGKVGERAPIKWGLIRHFNLTFMIPLLLHALPFIVASGGRGPYDETERENVAALIDLLPQTVPPAMAIGIFCWLAVALVQIRPAIIVKEQYISISRYGLLYDEYRLDRVKRMAVMKNGVFGTIIDFWFKGAPSKRYKIALGKFDCEDIRPFLGDNDFEIV